MLITNFAAGELAETLFGRVDLGQYYSGVSHLENFDVIPTGGISRRHGFKRIAVKNQAGNPMQMGEGRIIPFILNRDESFLLFLSPKVGSYPAAIRVFDRDGVQRGPSVASTPDRRLYETMEQINDVQYAQNYDKMVLVHEDYAPVEINLIGGAIEVSLFKFSYEIEVKVGGTVNEEEKAAWKEKEEADYADKKKYLLGPGNYPGCVCFYQGRLVFARTKKYPQRIYASKAGDIYNFSEYGLFLTERKDYVVAKGIVKPGKRIKLSGRDELYKFSNEKKLNEYIVDYMKFPTGTRVVGLDPKDTNTLEVSNSELEPEALSPEELSALDNLIIKYTNYSRIQVAGIPYYPSHFPYYVANNIRYPVGEIDTGNGGVFIDTGLPITILSTNFNRVVRNINLLENRNIKNLIDGKTTGGSYNDINADAIGAILLYDILWIGASGIGDFTDDVIPRLQGGNIRKIVDAIREAMKAGMVYGFRGTTYYGSPEEIRKNLVDEYNEYQEEFIPFYTRTILDDRYPVPDDGFTFEIASDMNDEIKWLAQNKNLLAGTETGEWLIPAGVNATNVQSVLNSRYGSDRIQGTTVGDAVCFFQTGKKALVEYYIPQQDNNFRANNMAMLSKNMLHESPAFDFDFISAPYTKIFVSRENGTMVCLLYERSTGTFAWGRITTGKETETVKNGVKVKTRTRLIRSVATVPGLSGYDDVYLLVQQGDSFHLERYSERVRGLGDEEDAVFLDCYQRFTGNGDRAGYFADAVLYDETDNKVYPYTHAPIPGHVMWIGYPYESRVRSMPVLANDQMKQNNIKNLHIRFNDSFMPRVRSVSMSEGKERLGNTDSIGRPEPYSGVVQVPFPGVWDRDVFFELVHDKPTRCRVLAVNAEAN